MLKHKILYVTKSIIWFLTFEKSVAGIYDTFDATAGGIVLFQRVEITQQLQFCLDFFRYFI